ncbi:MAG: hypothetical protein ACP5HQ_08400 [Thermoprotei archaeon]
MNERDLALVERVGQYYLQYKGIVDVERLLSLFKATREVSVNDHLMDYVRSYLIYLAVRSSVEAAKKARNERLTYREFATIYSTELAGALDVSRTVAVYPHGLVAYYDLVQGYNAPEYAVLGYLLRRTFSIAESEKRRIEEVEPQLAYFNFKEDFKRYFEELKELKENFPLGRYRDPTYTDPDWLKTAFRAYFLLKGLEEIKLGVKERGQKPLDQMVIELVLWKLYELYVFYLVVSVLEREGYRIRKVDGEKANSRYVAEKDGKRLNLVFNASLNSSKLRRVDGLTSPGDIERFRGRPDLSLYGRRPIIFECKYSTSVGYITMGRFKVMAYTYEYDPCLSVLVYPGVEEGPNYDEEDEATRELDERVEREGGVLEFEYNGHTILMARVDPLLGVEENLRVVERVLYPLLKGVESSCTE